MKRIDLRGVIVGSSYDADWAAPYIAKGRFTPDSHFRRLLAEAGGDDVEVYVCSQGGDVTAGYEIANAIKAYQGDVTLLVGAYAASMAANIVLTCGRPAKAFSNSILLFHGAFSVVMGGSGAMEDEARVLSRINAPIKAALVAHGVPESDVEEGFSEGRMYTMGAEEALSLGIVGEIVDGTAAQPEPVSPEDAEAIAAATEGAIPAAALAVGFGQPDTGRDPGSVPVPDPVQADPDARLEELRGEYARERDSLLAQIAALKDDLAKARRLHESLVGRVLGPQGCDRPHSDFREAVKALGYVEARRRYPELCAAFRR